MKFCRSESLDFLCLWVISARRWYWPTTSSYVWLCVYIWPELCLTLSRLIYFSSGSRANLHLVHFAKAFVCLISHYLFPFSFFPCIASSTRIIERSETCFLQNISFCSLVLHCEMASFSLLNWKYCKENFAEYGTDGSMCLETKKAFQHPWKLFWWRWKTPCRSKIMFSDFLI